MKTRFYEPASRPSRITQGVRRPKGRIQLTKDARAQAHKRQKQAAQKYDAGLKDAWAKISETAKELAGMHHKSLQRVQTDLHMYHLKINRSITLLIPLANILSNTYRKGAYKDKGNISNGCGDIK